MYRHYKVRDCLPPRPGLQHVLFNLGNRQGISYGLSTLFWIVKQAKCSDYSSKDEDSSLGANNIIKKEVQFLLNWILKRISNKKDKIIYI